MAFQLDNQIKKVPKGKTVSSWYLINDRLQYVSATNNLIYFLACVDCGVYGEELVSSSNEGYFDYYVLSKVSPIKSMICNKKDNIRYIEIVTVSGDFSIKKPKQHKEDTVINRYTNKSKIKLF